MTELNDIQETLDDIKAILMISNSNIIKEMKKNLLKENSIEKNIYDLCDGKTNEEIAKIIQKDVPYVRSNISRLREKGLIKTTKENGKSIHSQRF